MNETQLENVNCLCGSKRSRQLYKKNRPDINLCEDCGLVFTSPRLTQKQLLEGYNKNELSHFNESLRDNHQEELTAQRILKFIEKHKKEKTLLDVGSGTGSLLAAAKKNNWKVSGLEVNERAVNNSKNVLGLNVVKGSLLDQNIAENSIDVVSMVHSLEHETDPLAVLKKAYAILKPDGLLYIATPDISSLFSRLTGPKWVHLKKAHLYYFTRKTITELLLKAGFTVREYAIFTQTKSLGAVVDRLGKYSMFLSQLLGQAIRLCAVDKLSIKIKLGDVVQLAAVKTNDIKHDK